MTKQRNLVNQTIDRLNLLISQENYAVGQKLPAEKELAKELGVGRSTLREAVKILAFSNRLEVKQGSGTYIKNEMVSMSFSTKELLTARVMIEIEAATLIIANGYEVEHMLKLKELLFERNAKLEQGKFSEFVTIDEKFHFYFVQLSSNPFLIRWYQELLPALKMYQSTEILKTTAYDDNSDCHNALYEAIISKNLKAAILSIKKNSCLLS